MKIKVGIGQDSHRFDFENTDRQLVLGGVVFPNHAALKGNSDADVVLHAITNALSSITGVNIIGKVSDEMCLQKGITDSRVYLAEALKYLNQLEISHIAITIECKTPMISPKIDEMKSSISELLSVETFDVGITATTGEGLTDFGKGEGIQVIAILTAYSTE